MSAKNFTLLIFGFFVVVAVVVVVFVFTGDGEREGSEGSAWFLFGGSMIFFLGFFSFNRKWEATKLTARYLQTFDSSITLEEGANVLQKYSYLMLIASIILFAAGIFSLFI